MSHDLTPIAQPTRQLGRTTTQLPVIGLGCMGMSDFYLGMDRSRSLQTLRDAVELGVTHWDTADMYGPHTNEELLSEVLATHREQVFIATKFGIDRQSEGRAINGRPEYLKACCDASLKRLGVERIDLYYQHRHDLSVPIEETVGAMAELVKAGKVAHIGLSEHDADTVRKAHAVHPISAYQGELSPWTKVHESSGVLDVCAELGITFVAYSPLGRGFLTGKIKSLEDLEEGDWRKSNPRFTEAHFAQNLELVDTVVQIASEQGCTPAQVCLAWLIQAHEQVVCIPGTTKTHRLIENAQAAHITLTEAQLNRITAMPDGHGARYA